jgi:hypothetical protein
MSLDPPTYLASLQNNIRQRMIPWDGAVRTGTITEDQLSQIRSVDKVRKDQRKQTIDGDLDTYRALFLGGNGKPGVLEGAANAKRSDIVQYVLVLLGDLLDGMRLEYSNSSIFEINKALQEFQPFQKLSRSTQTRINHYCPSSHNPTTLRIRNHCSRLLLLQA